MNKLILSIAGISIVGFLAYTNSQDNTNHSQSSVAKNTKQEKPLTDEDASNLLAFNEQTSDASKPSSKTSNSTIATKSTNFDNFLSSDAFKNTNNLNNAFVLSDNQLSSKSIETVFSGKDFGKAIEVIQELEKDSDSWQREDALREQLTSLLGNKFQSETYSCNGRLCLIKFDYELSDINEDTLNKISDFGSNYTFSKYTKNDNDLMTYKGLFIKTDDPSKMVWDLNN
ncbi:hypothetical protein [Psychrobium sp. 1_MG-2023]|uniref:hypothetical protein n=1 Tax=Psychrobium sp. 1_MG-2023 TaxID=3062624 RepID=UPI000C31DC2C|nr:hypothetical protein [Psychrobium sp. 1_MG-2023]MDP2560447.1 hypothetical protein [Psychrobium sp. 1_MG-2023]PKF57893.1 hypothetical protein CW748_05075 [Alteromonadales bacterium alter-6D02]